MPARQFQAYVDRQHVRYLMINHAPASTAQEIAASAHIPGKEVAKTVMVKIDGRMAMAVLPASSQVDCDLLKQATGAPTGSNSPASRNFRTCSPSATWGPCHRLAISAAYPCMWRRVWPKTRRWPLTPVTTRNSSASPTAIVPDECNQRWCTSRHGPHDRQAP